MSTLQWVTDGGLETDLLFNKGVDLPEFAAFPLLADAEGRQLLSDYYEPYSAVAAAAGVGMVLETPTWRANRDWGRVLGYDEDAVARVNEDAVALVREVAHRADLATRVSGVVGPAGDGYEAGTGSVDSYTEHHAVQVRALAEAGVDIVHAMTMTTVAEALGVVAAARAAGVEAGISFTVETDGRLPDGTTLADAVRAVDEVAPPAWYGVNCAHPTHVSGALDGGAWQGRIACLRPNASTLSHAELDVMEELDTGDRDLLASSNADVLRRLGSVTTLGGCCGTDATHVARLWQLRTVS